MAPRTPRSRSSGGGAQGTSSSSSSRSGAVDVTAGAAVDRAVGADSMRLSLPFVGSVALPPIEHLVFYGAVVAMAAVELVDWPVALVIGVGKALAENRTHKTLRSVGDALEEAG